MHCARPASALLLIALLAGPGRPCGGFFCTTAPMQQTGERILFAADGQRVTTHVQIQYSGSAADFAWLLPVPAAPELAISHNEVFDQLLQATQPFFVLEWEENNACGLFGPPFARTVEASGGVADGAQVVSQERVGPYDTAVITAEDPQAVVAWLADNGYQLGELGAELLAPYVAEGFLFLALKLAPDRQVGDLQPIALSYPAEKPGIPIRLTAVATAPDLGVFAWVLGPHRAVPDNYLHVHINEARIDWFNGGFNYPQVVTEAADEADGRAFVTDYAGPAKIMDKRLYTEGRYDLERLRGLEDPAAFLDETLAQGFPRDAQMQTLIRRHIPMPRAVLEEGVLDIVFRGDREAYEQARQEGQLNDIAERSFYNDLRAYARYTTELDFDPAAFAAELETVVVEPLRRVQTLFAEHPYLTRLYTTLSAAEMTVDPAFAFNPDLSDVDNMRSARAHWECPEGNPDNIPLEEWVLVVTLRDGRQIRSRPFVDGGPRPILPLEPAAALIERLDASGPPEILRRLTAVSEEAEIAALPRDWALLANFPNPFNSGTVLPFRAPAEGGRATLRVYDLLGRPVRTLFAGHAGPGLQQLLWDGRDDRGQMVASGVYLYRLDAGGAHLARKLLFLR